MAVIRQTSRLPANKADLVKELAQEWKDETKAKQPLIYENEISQTRSLHVLVVWDKWANIEDRERSAIILEAFQSAFPERGPVITIALGLTMEEAIAMGYFPYKIEPLVGEMDEAEKDAIEKIMLAENENAIRTTNGLELRYRTFQEAFEAYERLNTKRPGCWNLNPGDSALS